MAELQKKVIAMEAVEIALGMDQKIELFVPWLSTLAICQQSSFDCPRYRQARLRSRRLQQWQRWCRTRRQRQVQLQGAAKEEIRHEVFRK